MALAACISASSSSSMVVARRCALAVAQFLAVARELWPSRCVRVQGGVHGGALALIRPRWVGYGPGRLAWSLCEDG